MKNRRNKHHVPPKKPDRHPRIIKVDIRRHRAYHMLFGNAKSFADACYILWRDWWDTKREIMPDVPDFEDEEILFI